jgi:hypothetical protein
METIGRRERSDPVPATANTRPAAMVHSGSRE